MGSFFAPKPSHPDFGDFGPCSLALCFGNLNRCDLIYHALKTISDRLKFLQNYLRGYRYRLNYVGINLGITDTDLALLIPYLIIGCRHAVPNFLTEPTRIPEAHSGCLSVIGGGGSWLQIPT